MAQTEFLAIEFVQDDHPDFIIWPSPFSGTNSTADFTTDSSLTSGTTTVGITTSTGFGVLGGRGSNDGSPPGYSYQRLYEDFLIASSSTGFLTLDFSGLIPNQIYQFTLYAWDPGASNGDDKVWSVTGGVGDPASAPVNFQDALIDNESFALNFEITTTAAGTFQVTNTAGFSQSAINGFTLAAPEVDPAQPPVITSPPQAVWDGGENFVIEVGVSGPEPLNYQWFLDGVAIGGANEASLTVTAADWQRESNYTVRVSNANGAVDSDAAEITLDLPEFPTREELTYEDPGPSSRRSGIAISEILYHPARRVDGREIEFIELYNSQPWDEDISGWRLSGEVDFVFSEGTLVPGQGYLVVARMPSDVEEEFGIDGVVGPWTGSLSNEGGRVRLRKPSDAIVLEVNYNDRGLWPLSADGAGHSLVLARPSFGEGNVRAWEAGFGIGGSPGDPDRVPNEELDHVFVSKVLSNSADPEEDFIELKNAAPFPIDLSGCTLSDARDSLTLYTIASASIAAGETIRFTESQLGFALGSDGDTVYLTNPGGNRVLDAVVLPPAATGIPFVRNRSDEQLKADADPMVVINEIMFHPPTRDEADEWIELHNSGGELIDLSGWAFTDGIEFIFPQGARIIAGGYLVIAKNRTRTLSNHPALNADFVLGDFDGSLSDGGERVALSRPVDGIFVEEDTVRYRDKDRGHRYADGRGASLERIDPRQGSDARSNWADSDESEKAKWTTVEFEGTLAHGNPAAQANQVQMFLLGPGKALVDQVEVMPEGGANVLTNGDFESGTSGWFFQGNQRRSRLETEEAFEGENSLQLVATRRGDTGPNRARARLDRTLASGSRATLRAKVRWQEGHPEFLMRLRGNWLEAAGRLELPTNLGTPGAVNSRAQDNAGPDIAGVRHFPVLPTAGEEVRVTAQISDRDGVDEVTLRYRLDPSNSVSELTMRDDGNEGDLTAGDGIFSAMIPGQSRGSLLAFTIEAEDSQMADSTFPINSEALIRVGEPERGDGFGTYRMWITRDSRNEWDSQPFRSNDPFSITFVFNNSRVIYEAGAYYGGNKDSHGDPLSGSVSYDVVLPAWDEFLGADKLTLDYPVRDATNQREQLMHWFADQLKLPTLHRRDIYLYMNGIRRQTIYHDAEQPDGNLANSHFPGNDGELFKTANDNETTDSGTRVRPFVRNRIDVFEADGEIRAARYRWTTGARARGSRTRLDDRSILDLVQRADDTGPDYEERLLEIVDMENWMRTWALIDLASFWDAFGNPNWKNTYLYKPEGGKWVQFTWDFDVGLGVFNDPVNQPLFPGNVDANLRRTYQTPSFIRSYWRAMDESLGSFFSGIEVSPVLRRKNDAYRDAGFNFTSPFSPSGAYSLPVPTWIDRRSTFIESQLRAVNEPFALTSPGDGFSTDKQVITLTGAAPVDATVIEINGIPLALKWTSVADWEANFTLQAGENFLLMRALNSDGLEIASESITVSYTGVGSWPGVVINEWMADNETALADPADGDFDDWIELRNPSATPVDLSGWFLSDDPESPFKYQIPDGFSIPVSGFLLVWADDETLQNGPDLHAAFKLNAGGESILLSAPDGTLIDRVDFDRQSPDKTMGVVEEDILVLASPSPRTENGRAAIDPSATFAVADDVLTFTVVTEPGFLYGLEMSADLLSWVPASDRVKAQNSTLTFEEPLEKSRRFYRIRRLP